MRRVLGVLGGMGPLATARFLERVAEMTETRQEQEHVDMIVYNLPSIPDRTGYLLDRGRKSPLPALLGAARGLARQRVSCIAIPCVTAHCFHREIQQAVPVPVLNGISLTASLLKDGGITRVGILATDGTIRAGLLARELETAGIQPIFPSSHGQRNVMHLIYQNVKGGNPIEPERFYAVAQELRERGSQILLLGCTELSLLGRQLPLREGVLDVLDVIAREAVLRCGGKLKPEYQILLQGGMPDADQYSGISGTNRCPCAG